MAKAYKQLAEKLLAEKISLEFPDFIMDSADISKGDICLSTDFAEIELHFNSEDNTYTLKSVKFKVNTVVVTDNDSLKDVHLSWGKGGKKVE